MKWQLPAILGFVVVDQDYCSWIWSFINRIMYRMIISSVLREILVLLSRVRNCLHRSWGINFVVSSETLASSVSREVLATSVLSEMSNHQWDVRFIMEETYRRDERSMMGFITPFEKSSWRRTFVYVLWWVVSLERTCWYLHGRSYLVGMCDSDFNPQAHETFSSGCRFQAASQVVTNS